jgi:hypothetical protein
MTLLDLFTTLLTQGHLPAKRAKDFKTSIRYFARAVGKDTPAQCQEGDFVMAPTLWHEKLDRYFGALTTPPSPHTVRNTRHNLRVLFRVAHEVGLLTRPQEVPRRVPRREPHIKAFTLTSPYRQRWLASHVPYRLAPDDWPADIHTAWHAYCASRQLKTRPITLQNRTAALSAYLGFLITIEDLAVHWDDLFQVPYIDQFVRWNSQRSQTTITSQARQVVHILRTIASQLEHPALAAIRRYERELPTPEPMHEKKDHWITLRELEQAGLALLQAARTPVTSHGQNVFNLPYYRKICASPGLVRAMQHQQALILRWLVRIPLRSRNMREMQLERNLYHDRDGHWHLHFRGTELKSATRNGRSNSYHVDLTSYCPELLPHLEEFLTVYRPRIPQRPPASYVFATRRGRPFTQQTFRRELADLVLRYANRRFYPHLIRTIWATEFLSQTRDVKTAAHILGDTVQVVLQRYQEVLDQEHQDRARQFLTAVLQ